MKVARSLSAFLGRRWVRIALSLTLTLLLSALLIATIYFTRYDLEWLAFLGGVLFAAVLALASHASKAEWVITRRTMQLERMREHLAETADRAKKTAESLRQAELRMRLVGEALAIPLIYVDRDLRCRYHNQACCDLTGLAGKKIDGQPLQDVAGAAYSLIMPYLDQTLAGAAPSYELAWPGENQTSLQFGVKHVPFPPQHERPFGFYIVLTPVLAQTAPASTRNGQAVANAVQKFETGAGDDGSNMLYLRTVAEQLMGKDEDPRARLERALSQNQFLLYTQKIQSLNGGALNTECHEILLRLQEEEDNLRPPGGFIAVAEQYGMLEKIDRWVVSNLISWCIDRRKSSPGWQAPLFCINLSESTLSNPEFARFVRQELTRPGFSADSLCFEISDIEVTSNQADVRRFISVLKPAGCRFTLDAFGGVKVSFSHLRGLDIDFIKIDGVIIQNILRNPADLAKLRAIQTVCRKIGVRTIAEFVESDETLEKLRELGIDYAQGFGIASPEPITKLP